MATIELTDRPPNGNRAMRAWLLQWLSPPTLLSLIGFLAMTSVAYYRLGQVEKDIAELQIQMRRDERVAAETYQRRDVLSEQLGAINERISGIYERLRSIDLELKEQRSR
jgi:hypothetical protein